MGLARPALAQPGLRALTDLARRAAIYAVPIYEMYRRRWRETVDPANPGLLTLNQLARAAKPSAGTPDTLESAAWLDLAREPMFLWPRDMGARPYDFAVVDMFGDTIDHVSQRLHGRRPPPHSLLGPSWFNPPPSDVRAIHATTNSVRLVGRIAVDGAADLAAARASQTRVLLETPAARNERRVLESQELMPAGSNVPEEPVAGWPELHPDDPWDLFVVAARVLGEGPIPERDAALVSAFAALKLRPGRRFDLLGFSPRERDALLAGIVAARADIRTATVDATRQIGGWLYPPVHPGDFGEDRLQRAVVASIDPLMPETAESMTLRTTTDSGGTPLDGGRRYALRFASDGPPPTRAFWSVSIQGQMVGGLRQDGVEEIDISHGRSAGQLQVDLRIIHPGASVMDGTWRPPDIVPIY